MIMNNDTPKRIISFSPPDISELEIAEVAEALRSGWITTGPRTKMLECRLAAYIETGRTDIKRQPRCGGGLLLSPRDRHRCFESYTRDWRPGS